MEQSQDASVFHSFSQEKGKSPMKTLLIFFFVIILGVGGGFFLAKGKSATTSSTTAGGNTSGQITKGAIYGSNDTSTFKDTATGVVQAGGVEGEGQYHLVRPGGDSQNVYMTSSLVDLSQFIGKKVTVNGQTQKAKKAGWLMDVGRVEVLN